MVVGLRIGRFVIPAKVEGLFGIAFVLFVMEKEQLLVVICSNKCIIMVMQQ